MKKKCNNCGYFDYYSSTCFYNIEKVDWNYRNKTWYDNACKDFFSKKNYLRSQKLKRINGEIK